MWLAFSPRDALHFRDGRSFEAGESARTLHPRPSTIAGAVGTALGREAGTVRGPLPASRRKGGKDWRTYFPLPADIVPVEKNPDRWTRLRPTPSSATTDLHEPGMLWLSAPRAGAPATDRWWSARKLQDYLNGTVVLGEKAGVEHSPFVVEHRTGIARDDRAVLDTHLYSSEFLRLPESSGREWAVLAQCVLTTGQRTAPAEAVRWGGEGRMADVEVVSSPIEWPRPPDTFPDGRVLVYLATPGIWRTRTPEGRWRTVWRPPLPANAVLRAAVIPGAEPVASASPQPDGTVREVWQRWAVPAGSVYLIEFGGDAPEAAAAEWAARVHGTALGAESTEPGSASHRLATAGFGLILTGRWND
ncbi:type III-B CRISPR module-associated Cmr3 family protein [Thermobifida halotolerans]|nr:type III-B CRISPR module-associated Cmr3 family protein [Thermobifida halotolerans]